MAKKNDGIIWHLMDAPWWLSLIVAAIVYISLSVVLPALAKGTGNLVFDAIAPNLSLIAPYLTFLFLVPTPIAFIKQFKRRRQFSSTTSEIAHRGTTEPLKSLTWLEFESYIGEFFKQQGYEVKQAFSQKPDGGVDIWMRKDGELTLVQCTHWKTRKVGIPILREMYAVMIEHSASKMIVVTSGDFTSEAVKYALDKKLWLINGGDLVNMIELAQHCRTEAKTKAELPAEPELICPSCHSTLVKRTAKRGDNKGRAFYGCSAYPRCRYTKNIGVM